MCLEEVISRVRRNSEILNQKNQECSQVSNDLNVQRTSYKCDKCSDTGWILSKRPHMMDLAKPCECRKILNLHSEWKALGINAKMSNYTFASYEIWNKTSEIAKDTAMSYFTSFNKVRETRQNSILLCGQVGSGKTHLSVAIALNLINKQVKVVYMPYRDVVSKLKRNVLDDEYYTRTIEKYQKCDVLLIDDMFKGKVNDSDVNIIFEIVNYRYLNYKPLIVSSEFDIEKLLLFDEAVGSRIYEMSKNHVIEIKNDFRNNYRLK